MDLVLNWLWQGGVVALAAAAASGAIPPLRAQARYCALWAGAVAVLALPAAPLVWAAGSQAQGAPGLPAAGAVVSLPAAWWTSTAAAASLWFAWCGLYACRVASAAAALRSAKRDCKEMPPEIEARLVNWIEMRAAGRRTRLAVSDRVAAAAVFGGAAPVIAVAPALLEQLDAADLDRVVAHEWAHVQRRDDLAQAAQLIVRMIAGWHPAVRWLERRLHLEREVACDQIAVAVTGSAKQYAACLATIAGLEGARRRPLPVPAVLSSGLRPRVVRILAAGQAAGGPPARWPWMAAAALFAGLALVLGRTSLVDTAFSSALVNRESRPAPAGPTARRSASAQSAATRGPLRGATAADRSRRPHTPAPDRHRERPPGTRTADAAGRPDGAQPPSGLTAPIASTIVMPQIALAPPSVAAMPLFTPSAAAFERAAAADRTSAEEWDAAVEAGKAVARGSEKAAVATADFFTRFGTKIAASF